MKFINYCIVVMGNMDGAKDDIIKIAETKPRYVDAKGVLIATFASVMNPIELEDFLKFEGRSFFIFDLHKECSAYHLDNEGLNTHLFGYLLNHEDKSKKMSEMLDDISATTRDSKVVKTKSRVVKPIVTKREIDITKLNLKGREDMVNKILDKGYEKLTNTDKKLLKKISELK